ncbi:DNA-binding TFAR19-related protein [Meredithblackwellia eburnea MCA 4105]
MDSDLEAIRAKRMAELQASAGGAGGAPLAGPGGPGGPGGEDMAQKQAQEEETRRNIMSQILSPEARERLSRIALVRPERARSIEQLLMRMAQSGQLRGAVSEQQLIGVLDQVEAAERGGKGGSSEKTAGKITFSRKQRLDDSDDDFDL